jgi:hypothetical protein
MAVSISLSTLSSVLLSSLSCRSTGPSLLYPTFVEEVRQSLQCEEYAYLSGIVGEFGEEWHLSGTKEQKVSCPSKLQASGD